MPRRIAILLALCTLAVTGVAGTAEAKGGGKFGAAAAQKMSKGAQVRLNRMKVKMALRPRGTMAQKTRRQLRAGKRKMVRAMNRRERIGPSRVQLMRASSRREVGPRTSEVERTRARFARDIDNPANMAHPDYLKQNKDGEPDEVLVTPDFVDQSSGAKQGKKMRDRMRKENTPPKKKIPKRRRD